MLSLILGILILLCGLILGGVLIAVGCLLIFGKMCNNPLATFILGLFAGHNLKS